MRKKRGNLRPLVMIQKWVMISEKHFNLRNTWGKSEWDFSEIEVKAKKKKKKRERGGEWVGGERQEGTTPQRHHLLFF